MRRRVGDRRTATTVTSSAHLALRRADPPLRGDRQSGGRILVVQHGEKERLPGDPGLTALGRRQAEATAAWLQAHGPVRHVVSSPLRRALETAAPIAACFAMAVSTDQRLRERMNWEGGGQSLAEFLAEWRRSTADRAYMPAGGESSLAAGARFLQALGALADKAPANAMTAVGDIVVVSHGGITVEALRTLVGDDFLLTRQPLLLAEGVPSCAITTFVRVRDGWHAEVPSVRHLARI